MSETSCGGTYEIQTSMPAGETLPVIDTATTPSDNSPDKTQSPDGATQSKYWGPLPGESPKLYEHLGIRTFKKYMPTTGDLVRRHVWSKLVQNGSEPGGYPAEETREINLEKLVKFTKITEIIHLGGFAMYGALATAGEVMGSGDTRSNVVAAVLAGFNLPVNIYPILLQRYNRLRAYRLLERIRSTENSQQLSN